MRLAVDIAPKLETPYAYLDVRTRRNRLKLPLVCLILLLSAFGEAYLYSLSLSPRPLGFFGADSSIFELIGKAWSEGYLPYVTYWDLKGPYLFLVNALGYLLGGHSGVFVCEVASLFVAKLFLWRTLRIAYGDCCSTVLACLAVSLYCSVAWDTGNTAAEWCLPFLCASFYYLYVYYRGGLGEHDWRRSVVYGLAFGVCVLTRMSNAVPLSLFVLGTMVVLVRDGAWRNLAINVLAGLAGVCCVLLPFSRYFYSQGALYDMWYGTILFNIEYFGRSAATTDVGSNMITFGVTSMLVVVFMAVLVLDVLDGNRASLYLLLPTLGSVAFLLMGNGYVHYYLVLLPITYICLAELRMRQVGPITYTLACVQLVTSLAFSLLVMGVGGLQTYTMPHSYDMLMAEIPDAERDSFLMVDAKTQGIYLKYDIYPNNRFFSLQTWNASFSSQLKDEIRQEFIAHEPTYVIVEKREDVSPCVYQDILDADYELLDTLPSDDGSVSLLRRQD